MARWQGIQSEILVSMMVIVVAATGLLSAVFLRMHAVQMEVLQSTLGRGLVAEARSPAFEFTGAHGDAAWWSIDEAGRVTARGSTTGSPDEATVELGQRVLENGGPLLDSGTPWTDVRFAMLDPRHPGLLVARLPAPASGELLLLLLLADGLIFAFFGATLLRGRVVDPLRRLAKGVRVMCDEGPGAHLASDGVTEVGDVAVAFNELSDALKGRTEDLQKAVTDLRGANQTLSQARAGLSRSERLALVGGLSAGVAHEVGNPMGALLAFLDLAGRDDGLSDKGREYLVKASEQGERIRVILRQLLDLSRKPRPSTLPISMRPIADQVCGLLNAQAAYSKIEVEVEEEEGLPNVIADEALLSQVILNLVLNAAAAVADLDAPRVRLELKLGTLSRRVGDVIGEQPPRARLDGVQCIVSDNGPGVPENLRAQIFDPFFTTKPPGEGTGLGLANAQKVIEELGGSLSLDEGPADLGGAAFIIALPLAGSEGATDGDGPIGQVRGEEERSDEGAIG